MHLRSLRAPSSSDAGALVPPPGVNPAVFETRHFSLEKQVQNPLNLVLILKNRAQMPALAEVIKAVQLKIDDAMTSLHDVHFARFLATPDYSALQVITSFDGDMEPYLLDFVKLLGDEFNAILEFIQNAPPLPVQRYPREFVAFVIANNAKGTLYSSYKDVTVLDILEGSNPVR